MDTREGRGRFDPGRIAAGGIPVPVEWNSVTERIIAAAIEVHTLLGPGLLESLYEQALAYELKSAGLTVERQRTIRLKYKEIELGDMRLDLIVENLVIVEIKAIERTLDVHSAQLLSYLRSADLPLGLLLNFNHTRLMDGVTRRINPNCTRLKNQ